MKTVFKKTVLLGAVLLVGMAPLLHGSSAQTQPDTYQRVDPVTTFNQSYVFNPVQPGSDISTRIPRQFAVINTTLADLQEGMYGNFLAEHMNSVHQEFLKVR